MISGHLHEELARLRREKGLSIRAASLKTGVGRSTIGEWEQGGTTPQAGVLREYLVGLLGEGPEARRLMGLRDRHGERTADPVPLGAVLASLRCLRDLGLRQAAAAIGVQPTRLLRWERGETEIPEETLFRLVAALTPDPVVHAELMALRRRSPGGELPKDPEAELPPIFQRPGALYELRLASLELHARRRSQADSRWSDWLARLRFEAVGGFLVKGAGHEARLWAAHGLRDLESIDRHPETRDALFVLHRLPKCRTATQAERSARSLLSVAERAGTTRNPVWALVTSASKWAEAGCPLEALRTLDRALPLMVGDTPDLVRAGFRSRVLAQAGEPAAALDVLERTLPDVRSEHGEGSYAALWLGHLRVMALARLDGAGRAAEALADFRAQTAGAGENGAGWWRKTREEMPRRLAGALAEIEAAHVEH